MSARRGYATERQKGFLIIEKLDYLQSRLLQKILFNISKPVKKLSIWINEVTLHFCFIFWSPFYLILNKLLQWVMNFPFLPLMRDMKEHYPLYCCVGLHSYHYEKHMVYVLILLSLFLSSGMHILLQMNNSQWKLKTCHHNRAAKGQRE